MKRTNPTTVVIVGLVAAVAGYLLDIWLASAGHPLLVPPVTLAVTLAVLGGLVVALAWPVRRVVRGAEGAQIDPFRAARTVVLAKASAITGSLLAGGSAGLLVFLLTRSVVGDHGNVWQTLASVVGGAILLAGGLVAEAFCTLPPPGHDSDADGDAPEPQPGHSHA